MISEQTGRGHQHGPCESIPLERMRWFTGRFVTARDLTDEQRYMVHRRYLINRMMHGEGVLCGLDVVPHERDDCAPTTVWIEPGIALDCCGRELISPCRLCVTWPDAHDPSCEPPEHEEKLLVIRYREEAVDPQYALLETCTTKVGQEATRIREGVSWKLAGRDELPHCWPGEHAPVHDDCDDGADGRGCIEPYCRCGGWVPLAVLTRREGGPIRISDPLSARLPGAGYLTRISDISWLHGGRMELHELAERHGRARGRLRPAAARGGRRCQRHQPVHLPGPVRWRRTEPGVRAVRGRPSPGRRDQGRLHDRPRPVGPRPPATGRRGTWHPSLQGQFVTVTLLCDFILDCHGNPVDGDHLRGRLPSGNGTPGGVFRSWFTVS